MNNNILFSIFDAIPDVVPLIFDLQHVLLLRTLSKQMHAVITQFTNINNFPTNAHATIQITNLAKILYTFKYTNMTLQKYEVECLQNMALCIVTKNYLENANKEYGKQINKFKKNESKNLHKKYNHEIINLNHSIKFYLETLAQTGTDSNLHKNEIEALKKIKQFYINLMPSCTQEKEQLNVDLNANKAEIKELTTKIASYKNVGTITIRFIELSILLNDERIAQFPKNITNTLFRKCAFRFVDFVKDNNTYNGYYHILYTLMITDITLEQKEIYDKALEKYIKRRPTKCDVEFLNLCVLKK